MHFGVGGNGDLEIRDALQPRDEVSGVGKTVRMRLVVGRALGRIAPQRDDVTDAPVVVLPRDVENLAPARAHTSQMWRARERRLPLNAGDDLVRAGARR